MVLPAESRQYRCSETEAPAAGSPAAGSVFAETWLDLRERADHAARAGLLHPPLNDWLQQRAGQSRQPLQLVDLGCGHGSNLRYLAPRLTGPQQWLLVDHDAALLERTSQRCARLTDDRAQPIHVARRQADLQQPLALDFEHADLISASALLDLVSHQWLEQLAECCHRHAAAALLTLSIDGVIELCDASGQRCEDERDRQLFEALAHHQQRDKGFGTALGSDAPAAARAIFEASGHRVTTARSDWHLAAARDDDCTLLRQLFKGWQQALMEQLPTQQAVITEWYHRHLRQLDAGRLGARIGHLDLLALPPDGAK
ncbi:methyltransferase family protein [Kushneria sinocarnis]|uniref:Methyltransferase family protein n=1 Tax=Kushneria sinocarnis TaxID=595502 RepID=A0A420WV40_9GAMM|nr:class I SAM-dependent methyltransferase [Kushneria sinocarnis]RKR02416.1 methyltransferase family protein [Kushneria sinocarnis]